MQLMSLVKELEHNRPIGACFKREESSSKPVGAISAIDKPIIVA